MNKDKTAIPAETQPTEKEKVFTQEEINKIVSERVNQLNAKHSEEIEKTKEQVLKELELSKEKLEVIKDISTDELKKITSFSKQSDTNGSHQVASSFSKPMPKTYEVDEESSSKIDISNL